MKLEQENQTSNEYVESDDSNESDDNFSHKGKINQHTPVAVVDEVTDVSFAQESEPKVENESDDEDIVEEEALQH